MLSSMIQHLSFRIPHPAAYNKLNSLWRKVYWHDYLIVYTFFKARPPDE